MRAQNSICSFATLPRVYSIQPTTNTTSQTWSFCSRSHLMEPTSTSKLLWVVWLRDKTLRPQEYTCLVWYKLRLKLRVQSLTTWSNSVKRLPSTTKTKNQRFTKHTLRLFTSHWQKINWRKTWCRWSISLWTDLASWFPTSLTLLRTLV